MERWFAGFAQRVARWAGSPFAFGGAVAVVLMWALAGFVAGFGNALYQLAINTGTTIVTFLLLFIVQSTQNRDSAALNVKLDAIITALDDADNGLLDAEDRTASELDAVRDGVRSSARAVTPPSRPRRP